MITILASDSWYYRDGAGNLRPSPGVTVTGKPCAPTAPESWGHEAQRGFQSFKTPSGTKLTTGRRKAYRGMASDRLALE